MNNSELLILFATQTGTAQYLAESLYRTLFGRISIRIEAIEDYDFIRLPDEKSVLFFISTTGDGDVPTTMSKFWKFILIKNLPKDSLKNVGFSVFGLGDSSYIKFNYAGRKLRNRLLQLSAQEILSSRFGDEQHPCGVETEYLLWLEEIENKFPANKVQQENKKVIDVSLDNNKFFVDNEDKMNNVYELQFKQQITPSNHEKKTIELNFYTNIEFNPGDIFLIYPENHETLITQIIGYLGLKIDDLQKTINYNGFRKGIPTKLNLRQLLTNHINLTSPPTRYFLKRLSEFVTNDMHRQKLIEMSSNTSEGLEEYFRYVYRERRNVCEIIYDFQPCQINLEMLIDSLSLIRPREYSICSIPEEKKIQIIAALVEYKTNSNRLIKGLCSRFLEDLQQGQFVKGEIKKGTLQFPNDCNIPVIMIGPGTGVAPFISFIKQRFSKQGNFISSNTILYFGSCYREKEFYFQSLLEKLCEEKKIILFTAFSRDQNYKIYVQDRIKENDEFMRDQIVNNFNKIQIFLAGTSRKMPSQVEETISRIINPTRIQQLKSNQQYVTECW